MMEKQLSTLRKRRGVVRASITRLKTRVTELERVIDDPSTLEASKQVLSKLEVLDGEFKVAHLSIVDLTENEDSLYTEQDTLDTHDDEVALLGLRVRQIITTCSPSNEVDPRKVPLKRLTRLQRALVEITNGLSALPDGRDGVVLLRQYESDFKKELGDIRNTLFALDLEHSDGLNVLQIAVEQTVFDRTLDVKKSLLAHSSPAPTPSSDAKGVRLPKIDVPTFDGNLLHWNTFWKFLFIVSLVCLTQKSLSICSMPSRVGQPSNP